MADQPYHFVPDLTSLLGGAPEDSIVSRSLFRANGVTATLFSFAEGEELSEHTASFPAILHFLKGEGALSLGGETMAVVPGSWVYMTANLPHSIVASTPLQMLLLLLRPEGQH
jgi:quercetin dioxygenase-like cupin family protein